MSEKTPNYYVDEDIHIGFGSDSKTIEAGSFVRPIEYEYVPKFVLDQWVGVSRSRQSEFVFCYTRFGIVPIPRKRLKISE